MSSVSHRTVADPEPARRDSAMTSEVPGQVRADGGPGRSGRAAVRSGDRAGPGADADAGPGRATAVPRGRRTVRCWPVVVLALPAAVAVWSGWVGIGQMTGFGEIRPLPGIWDALHLDTAITLPVGVEAYAAFALRVWLTSSPAVGGRTRRFARWSAIAALVLGMAGQVAYHLLRQAGMTRAPWEVTMLVSCLPVLVLGAGSALAHLLRADTTADVMSGRPVMESASALPRGVAPARSPRLCGGIGRRPAYTGHPHAAAAGYGPGWARRAGGSRAGNPGTRGAFTRHAAGGRPPARMRMAEARAVAAKVAASGQRISRRSLRSAGLHGSNADLGMLARLVRSEPRKSAHAAS